MTGREKRDRGGAAAQKGVPPPKCICAAPLSDRILPSILWVDVDSIFRLGHDAKTLHTYVCSMLLVVRRAVADTVVS